LRLPEAAVAVDPRKPADSEIDPDAAAVIQPPPADAAGRPAMATLVLLASLYCAQGLPSGLIAHSLPVLLRQHGVDLAVIGLLKLLALPWMLKVLWAPWVDRIASARLGHHRGWILPLQTTVIVCVASLAADPPGDLVRRLTCHCCSG
jgi:hypothetical protein